MGDSALMRKLVHAACTLDKRNLTVMVSSLTATQAAEVAALLKKHGAVLVPPPSAAAPEGKGSTTREALVLDAACGKDEWQLEQLEVVVEFEEDEAAAPGSWSCCVSMVVRLSWANSSHDETGTGLVTAQKSREAARDAARTVALKSGMKRLAKRFAASLGQPVLIGIEKELRAQGGGEPSAKRR